MIVVTGGAGFIGSNLIEGLERTGIAEIALCDWFGKDDKWRNVSKREIRDIVAPERLLEYLESHVDVVEVVFHMGAVSSTTEQDVDKIVENNVRLSRDLWRWCANNNKRFIYASSATTYGNGLEGFDDRDDPEYLEKLRPLSAYGWSKHMFDRRVSRVTHKDGAAQPEKAPQQWVGLKLFNVFGPNEYHKGEQASVLSKLYPQISAGAAARLFSSYHPDYDDGEQCRDFVYVKDVVDVMLWVLDNPRVNGIFNVGTGKARSFNELAKAVFYAMGKQPKINYIDMPQALQSRYQYYTEANIDKLREAGYNQPFMELEEAVTDYIQNYLTQPDRYL